MKLNTLSYPWSEARKSEKKLKIKSNRPFIFVHNPQNWELIYTSSEDKRKKEKPLLVPNFSVLRLEPGINNVQLSGSKISINRAVADAQENGFTIIDPEDYNYIKVFPALGGKYYCDIFTSFEQIGSSLITNFDHQSFNDFRRKLILDKVISLPHKHFIRLLLSDNLKIITKYSSSLHNPNHEALHNKAVKVDNDLKFFMKQIEEQGIEYYG